MTRKDSLIVASALLALVACADLGGTRPYRFDRRSSDAEPNEPRDANVLYARDGTVVDGTTAPAKDVAPRDVAPSETGRTYILELYQKAIDERDALRAEVGSLGADLQLAKTKLADSDAELADLKARVTALEGEAQRRLDENLDLAARLVTAQIRRLQSEKILLEARLAESRNVAAQTPAQK